MSNPIGYYHVKLRVAQQGPVGAPVLHLNLGVDAPTGRIVGAAEIDQSLPPPYGKVLIPQVTGEIFHTGFGKDTRLVHLTGQYVVSLPPPAIGSYLAQFSTALAVDEDWNGKGSFNYGNHHVSGCQVTKESKTEVSAAKSALLADA